jgi:hypothetical protein
LFGDPFLRSPKQSGSAAGTDLQEAGGDQSAETAAIAGPIRRSGFEDTVVSLRRWRGRALMLKSRPSPWG